MKGNGNGNGKKPDKKPVALTRSPKGGAALVPGNPGNSGGKKGRSGRLPNEYRDLCRDMLHAPKTQAQVTRILNDSSHPHFASIYKHLAEHAYGKATQPIGNADTGDTTIRVVWEQVPAPYAVDLTNL